MAQTIAICPGSFDPITIGHLDIISRTAKMFDKVIVVVMDNVQKKNKTSFTSEERRELISRCVTEFPNVEVDNYSGLLAEYAKQKGAVAIVKGLRAVSDYEYEFQQALINKKLNPDVDTIFMSASTDNMFLSSSIVKHVSALGGDVNAFLPEPIREDVLKRIQAG